MVSWRDPQHPRAGGAERYTALALRALVEDGMRVTWLVPAVRGLPATACIDGVTIIRRGRGVAHVPAAAAYLARHRRTIDLVIDQANGYPMFTMAAYRGPRLLMIHQLARDVWFHHLPWPLARIAYALEPWSLLPYRRGAAVTVSRSTAQDLEAWGFGDVRVVPIAVAAPEPVAARTPPSPPRFVALGRLVASKRLDHVLDAFELVRASIPEARLHVIGSGHGRVADALEARAERVPGASLERDVSEARKWDLLRRATALVATSVREGWGLVATEAHAVGTPTVAYDVHGLRDSTTHGVNGLMCEPTPRAAAEAMLHLAQDSERWHTLNVGAMHTAAAHTVERLSASMVALVRELIDG